MVAVVKPLPTYWGRERDIVTATMPPVQDRRERAPARAEGKNHEWTMSGSSFDRRVPFSEKSQRERKLGLDQWKSFGCRRDLRQRGRLWNVETMKSVADDSIARETEAKTKRYSFDVPTALWRARVQAGNYPTPSPRRRLRSSAIASAILAKCQFEVVRGRNVDCYEDNGVSYHPIHR